MPKYHVGQSPITNVIYAGTLNREKTMWVNKADVTEEAIASVRDHLVEKAKESGRSEFGYEWKQQDGSTVQLLVKIIPEGEKENAEIH